MTTQIDASVPVDPAEPGCLTARAVLKALWPSRFMMGASVLVAGVLSAAIAFFLPKVYESSATLLVMPPPFKEVTDIKEEKMGLFPRPLGVQDYAVLLQRDAVLMEVAERVGKMVVMDPKELDVLKRPSVLRQRMSVQVTVNEKTAAGAKYSPALILTARGSSPEVAQALAQAWGEVAEQQSVDLYVKSQGDQAHYILEQFREVQTELARVFDEQQANEAAFNPEEFNLRLESMTKLLSQLEESYVTTVAEVDALRMEVQDLQARLAGEERTLVLFNSPPMTAVFLDAKLVPKDATKSPEDEPDVLGYRSEQLNPVYVSAAQLLVERQALLAGREEQLKTLERHLEELRKSIDAYRSKSAQLNHERKRLEKEEAVYGKSYLDLANRYQQARIAEGEEQTMADIQLVADAVLPDRKVAPARSAIVLAAMFLALLGSGAWSICRHLLKCVVATA